MIKIKKVDFLFPSKKISESEITADEACRILHSLTSYERLGITIIYESNEDKKQLIETYSNMYHDEFNIKHNIDDEEQMDLQLAYPATNDVFYIENLLFRFEAGIRDLDPNYARVNTHQTVFTFQATPFYECIALNNAPDEQTKIQIKNLVQYVICKHEQLNHPSYEDAKEYLEQVWLAYQEFFNDNIEVPNIKRIIDVNKNFDVPWYDRL